MMINMNNEIKYSPFYPMTDDFIEIECFCQVNDCCLGCPYEDECFESYRMFGTLHHDEWMNHFTRIIYAEGEI